MKDEQGDKARRLKKEDPAAAADSVAADTQSEESDLDPDLQETKDELTVKLETPGALEVETMPETNELQRRREQTKKRLRELSRTDEPGDEPDFERPFEQNEGGLMAILKEANLGPRHLRFCFSGVIGLGLIFLIIFFGWKFIQSDPFSGDGRDGKDNEETVDEVDDDEDFGSDFSDLDESVESALILGDPSLELDLATGVGEEIGTAPVTDSTFAESLRDFASIYNSMQVNVQELLDQSNERDKALAEYLDDLNFHLYLGRQILDQLNEESRDLEDRFQQKQDDQAAAEEEFFADLRNLDANAAAAALEEFEELGQEVVELRAEFNARQTLISFYENLLDDVELRAKDIEVNREALVKGIQVVDIQGSDIDLIIDESEI